MPRLEDFNFDIQLEDFSRGEFTTDDLALGDLPSLRHVNVGLYGEENVSQEVVTKVKEKLRHEADVHPNHPSLLFIPPLYVFGEWDPDVVTKVEEKLRHEADVHPNHPSLSC
jgi:hypothetical protein